MVKTDPMSSRPRALVSWSSGKDSAFALWQSKDVEIVGLLTTVTRAFGRVSMHGVREELLDRQADALGLPLLKVEIPSPCPNEVYEEQMRLAMDQARRMDVTHVVFGDLFLQDIRSYREEKLRQVNMTPIFPLWLRDTKELAREMIASGLRAHLTCVDPRKLDRSFAGRTFDATLLADLPPGVDPCGENGEFHTFVSAGPMFARPIAVMPGEVVERDGFVFADLTARAS
jgi:uncharacterized protein (TIGR00290 family)